MYIAFKISLIEALKCDRYISLIKLETMQNLIVNCTNCLLIKFNIWIYIKKKTFWLMPFCPHFQPCYWAPKKLQPLQSTGERLEGESKGEVSVFLLLFVFCSIFLQWLFLFHSSLRDSPTLCDSSPISQTSPYLNFWLSQDGPCFQNLKKVYS